MNPQTINQLPGAAAGATAIYQDAFVSTLLAPEEVAPVEIAALAAQPAFAVYRNTIMKGCIDALQAGYPAILRLVGEEWFRAAAAIFVRKSPPTVPMLLEYGRGFAEFLEGFAPAADMPYLPGVARLDRCWTQAHIAADEIPLDAAAIANLEPAALAGAVLHPHSAAHWGWFGEAPIYTIWSRNRSEEVADDALEWHGEGALLTRPHGVVTWHALDAAGCAFLDACAAGLTLDAAAHAALATHASADLARLMEQLLVVGAFGRMTLVNEQENRE